MNLKFPRFSKQLMKNTEDISTNELLKTPMICGIQKLQNCASQLFNLIYIHFDVCSILYTNIQHKHLFWSCVVIPRVIFRTHCPLPLVAMEAPIHTEWPPHHRSTSQMAVHQWGRHQSPLTHPQIFPCCQPFHRALPLTSSLTMMTPMRFVSPSDLGLEIPSHGRD